MNMIENAGILGVTRVVSGAPFPTLSLLQTSNATGRQHPHPSVRAWYTFNVQTAGTRDTLRWLRHTELSRVDRF
jgi:hypothetical protein